MPSDADGILAGEAVLQFKSLRGASDSIVAFSLSSVTPCCGKTETHRDTLLARISHTGERMTAERVGRWG